MLAKNDHAWWKRAAAPPLVLVLAVAAAGCSPAPSGGPGSSPVASLPGHAGTSRPVRPPTQAQSDQDMTSFTRCMRGHGVAMADPFHRPGHAGLTINMPTRDAATMTAYHVCIHFLTPIIAAKQAGAGAAPAAELAALTRYAQCMRSHDINMLDPTTAGQLNLGQVPGITDDFGRYSPQFRAADTACRDLLPAGVHDNGTGP